MSSGSKYFDSIRVGPRKARGERNGGKEPPVNQRPCNWNGCDKPGTHRAPQGRTSADMNAGYQWFCLDHVRQHNQSYNYFQGMSDEDIAVYQKANATGHRPTWKLGVNGAATPGGGRPPELEDPYNLMGEGETAKFGENDKMPRRPPRNAERKALMVLGLEATASLNEIKSRYKELVKRHHPDANGGDRSSEDRLRKIIQAYDYLKKSGFF